MNSYRVVLWIRAENKADVRELLSDYTGAETDIKIKEIEKSTPWPQPKNKRERMACNCDQCGTLITRYAYKKGSGLCYKCADRLEATEMKA